MKQVTKKLSVNVITEQFQAGEHNVKLKQKQHVAISTKTQRKWKEIRVEGGNSEPSWEEKFGNEKRNLFLGSTENIPSRISLSKIKVELKHEECASPKWCLNLTTEDAGNKKRLCYDVENFEKTWTQNECFYQYSKRQFFHKKNQPRNNYYQPQLWAPDFYFMSFQNESFYRYRYIWARILEKSQFLQPCDNYYQSQLWGPDFNFLSLNFRNKRPFFHEKSALR